MGVIIIPYWFILACVAVFGIFWSGYVIGSDVESGHGAGMVTIYFGPLILLASIVVLLVSFTLMM